MTFQDAVLIEVYPLKMTIDIGGIYKSSLLHAFRPSTEHFKSCVRNRIAIELVPVPVKPPSERRVVLEPPWISHFLEANSKFRDWRVCFPETFIPSKIRQTGIYTETGTCPNEHGISLPYYFSCLI